MVARPFTPCSLESASCDEIFFADASHLSADLRFAAKAATLLAFADQPILLAVAEAVQKSIPETISATVVPYKSSLKICDMLDAVNRLGRESGD